MGLSYQELQNIIKNSTVLEKQKNIEIKQTTTDCMQIKKTIIRERLLCQPQHKTKAERGQKKSLNKDITKGKLSKEQTSQEQGFNLGAGKQTAVDSLQDLNATQLYGIGKWQKGGLKEDNKTSATNNRQANNINKSTETNETWADYLAGGKGIAKEKFSLQHQCVSTPPLYSDDDQALLPRPRKRSVSSQMPADRESLEQGAAGDQKSNTELKANNIKDVLNKYAKADLANITNSQQTINCCYGFMRPSLCPFSRPLKAMLCHGHGHSCQQMPMYTKREYTYCHDEYYYDCANCRQLCHSNCKSNTTKCHHRRQHTDLETEQFCCRPEKQSCRSPKFNSVYEQSKRKCKNILRKNNESSQLKAFVESTKTECEKLRESVKRQMKMLEAHKAKAASSEKPLKKTATFTKLLSESEAKELVKCFDRCIDEREKKLKLANKQNVSDSRSAATVAKTSHKTQPAEFHKYLPQMDSPGQSSKSKYSLETFKMLKKMKIREYKPQKPQHKKLEDDNKQVLNKTAEIKYTDKTKNYQYYLQKFGKANETERCTKTKQESKNFKEAGKNKNSQHFYEDINNNMAEKAAQYASTEAASFQAAKDGLEISNESFSEAVENFADQEDLLSGHVDQQKKLKDFNNEAKVEFKSQNCLTVEPKKQPDKDSFIYLYTATKYREKASSSSTVTYHNTDLRQSSQNIDSEVRYHHKENTTNQGRSEEQTEPYNLQEATYYQESAKEANCKTAKEKPFRDIDDESEQYGMEIERRHTFKVSQASKGIVKQGRHACRQTTGERSFDEVGSTYSAENKSESRYKEQHNPYNLKETIYCQQSCKEAKQGSRASTHISKDTIFGSIDESQQYGLGIERKNTFNVSQASTSKEKLIGDHKVQQTHNATTVHGRYDTYSMEDKSEYSFKEQHDLCNLKEAEYYQLKSKEMKQDSSLICKSSKERAPREHGIEIERRKNTFSESQTPKDHNMLTYDPHKTATAERKFNAVHDAYSPRQIAKSLKEAHKQDQCSIASQEEKIFPSEQTNKHHLDKAVYKCCKKLHSRFHHGVPSEFEKEQSIKNQDLPSEAEQGHYESIRECNSYGMPSEFKKVKSTKNLNLHYDYEVASDFEKEQGTKELTKHGLASEFHKDKQYTSTNNISAKKSEFGKHQSQTSRHIEFSECQNDIKKTQAVQQSLKEFKMLQYLISRHLKLGAERTHQDDQMTANGYKHGESLREKPWMANVSNESQRICGENKHESSKQYTSYEFHPERNLSGPQQPRLEESYKVAREFDELQASKEAKNNSCDKNKVKRFHILDTEQTREESFFRVESENKRLHPFAIERVEAENNSHLCDVKQISKIQHQTSNETKKEEKEADMYKRHKDVTITRTKSATEDAELKAYKEDDHLNNDVAREDIELQHKLREETLNSYQSYSQLTANEDPSPSSLRKKKTVFDPQNRESDKEQNSYDLGSSFGERKEYDKEKNTYDLEIPSREKRAYDKERQMLLYFQHEKDALELRQQLARVVLHLEQTRNEKNPKEIKLIDANKQDSNGKYSIELQTEADDRKRPILDWERFREQQTTQIHNTLQLSSEKHNSKDTQFNGAKNRTNHKSVTADKEQYLKCFKETFHLSETYRKQTQMPADIAKQKEEETITLTKSPAVQTVDNVNQPQLSDDVLKIEKGNGDEMLAKSSVENEVAQAKLVTVKPNSSLTANQAKEQVVQEIKHKEKEEFPPLTQKSQDVLNNLKAWLKNAAQDDIKEDEYFNLATKAAAELVHKLSRSKSLEADQYSAKEEKLSEDETADTFKAQTIQEIEFKDPETSPESSDAQLKPAVEYKGDEENTPAAQVPETLTTNLTEKLAIPGVNRELSANNYLHHDSYQLAIRHEVNQWQAIEICRHNEQTHDLLLNQQKHGTEAALLLSQTDIPNATTFYTAEVLHVKDPEEVTTANNYFEQKELHQRQPESIGDNDAKYPLLLEQENVLNSTECSAIIKDKGRSYQQLATRRNTKQPQATTEIDHRYEEGKENNESKDLLFPNQKRLPETTALKSAEHLGIGEGDKDVPAKNYSVQQTYQLATWRDAKQWETEELYEIRQASREPNDARGLHFLSCKDIPEKQLPLKRKDRPETPSLNSVEVPQMEARNERGIENNSYRCRDKKQYQATDSYYREPESEETTQPKEPLLSNPNDLPAAGTLSSADDLATEAGNFQQESCLLETQQVSRRREDLETFYPANCSTAALAVTKTNGNSQEKWYEPESCTVLATSERHKVSDSAVIMPSKSNLKSGRLLANPQTESDHNLAAHKTATAISNNAKNVTSRRQQGNSITCNFGQEKKGQQIIDTNETDQLLPRICTDCELENQADVEDDCNNNYNYNNSYTIQMPAFKQCPCMWDTYVEMMNNYYKGKQRYGKI